MENATPTAVELKATSLSELLDRTFTVYRNNFWLVCGIMVLPEAGLLLLTLVQLAAFPVTFTPAARSDPSNPFAAFAGMQSNIASTLGLGLLRGLGFAFVLGCMTYAVSEIYLGRRTTIRQTYAAVVRRIPGLFGLFLVLSFIAIVFVFILFFILGVVGAVVGGAMGAMGPGLILTIAIVGMIAGFFLGFWLMIRFAVSVPAFVLENRGVFNSLARSNALTKGHRWRIFVACFVMLCIFYVVQLVFAIPISILMAVHLMKGSLPFWIQVAANISGAISSIVAMPLLMITMSLFYYDVRIRKEAFDLETMISALGNPDAISAGPGAPPPFQSAQ